MAVLVVILMYATWSSIFSIGKWTLQFAPPLFLTSARMVLAGLILSIYLFIYRKGELKLSMKKWLSIGVLAIFSIYLANAFEFWGLQHLSSAKTCFIYSLSPFFAAFFSYIHFKEKMNGKKWFGMLIGFLGFIPVLFTQTGSEGLLQAFAFVSWPELAIMGAALCAVYGWVLLRLLVKDNEISPLVANGLAMLIGGSIAFVHSFVVEPWSPTPPVSMENLTPFMLGLLTMTLVSNIICYNLYGLMLKRFTATFLSFMGLLSPIFASLNGWIFLGEIPSKVIIFSTGAVTFGLWIVYQAELKQGYIQKAKEATPTTT